MSAIDEIANSLTNITNCVSVGLHGSGAQLASMVVQSDMPGRNNLQGQNADIVTSPNVPGGPGGRSLV